jgi:hypothetical protein
VRIRLIYALDVVEELCLGDLALPLDVSEDADSTNFACSAPPPSSPASKVTWCSTGSPTTSQRRYGITAFDS